MKSTVTLLLAGLVTLVCGQYFGWWAAPLPGLNAVPSYQETKMAREARRSKLRQIGGLEDENGNAINNDDSQRRAEALKEGEKIGSY